MEIEETLARTHSVTRTPLACDKIDCVHYNTDGPHKEMFKLKNRMDLFRDKTTGDIVAKIVVTTECRYYKKEEQT